LYRERSEILKNWKRYVNEVARAAESLLKNCEVYSFGSAVRGKLTAASDIDVLIIAEDLPQNLMERAKVKGEIERLANLPPYHPIQIHLITRNEAKNSSIYSKATEEGLKIKFNR